METELHLAAGYCAATGVYRSGHPPQFAAAAALSFPEYILPRMLLPGRRARPAFVDASTGAALSFAGLRALSLRVRARSPPPASAAAASRSSCRRTRSTSPRSRSPCSP